VTDNEGQQYPPQEPVPEYWQQQYPPQEPATGYDPYPQQPFPQQPAAPGYEQTPYAQPGYEQQQYQQPAAPGYGYDYQPQQYQPQQPAAPDYGYQPEPAPAPGYETYDTYETYESHPPGAYPAEPYPPGRYTADQYPVAQTVAPAPAPAAPASPAAPAAAQQPVPPQRRRPAAPAAGPAPGRPADADGPGYASDEFAFVEDAEESADVIDWMKFSETRGERRDERRRRLRGRALVLGVVLLLLAAGGVGYLWADGKLFGSSSAAVPAATGRQVIVVHLHDASEHVYTALLISDAATHKGTTLLIPGNLDVPPDGGGSLVPLGANVDSQGNPSIRTGLNTVLGSNITASWGLYSSFLQVLVDRLNGITVDSDATIVQGGKTVVSPGTATLGGAAAIAYASYQAKGEAPGAQLARFGQVLEGVIKAMPPDPTSAAADITAMGEVADPSLPDAALGALLATLSADANNGNYQTDTLPVQADGSPGPGASTVVAQLLGGSVAGASGGATAARVAVVNASGTANNANLADAAVTNNGYTWVPGHATAPVRADSTIEYSDPSRAADAQQLAEDLGLPASAVRKVTTALPVDLLVTLGKDYHQD
jgi:LytR cell envelope-related transcriptional attenuator